MWRWVFTYNWQPVDDSCGARRDGATTVIVAKTHEKAFEIFWAVVREFEIADGYKHRPEFTGVHREEYISGVEK